MKWIAIQKIFFLRLVDIFKIEESFAAKIHQNCKVCCGLVGRAVTSNNRDPQFESSHWQLLLNQYFLLTVCRKDENERKRGRKWPIRQRLFLSRDNWHTVSLLHSITLYLLYSITNTLSIIIVSLLHPIIFSLLHYIFLTLLHSIFFTRLHSIFFTILNSIFIILLNSFFIILLFSLMHSILSLSLSNTPPVSFSIGQIFGIPIVDVNYEPVWEGLIVTEPYQRTIFQIGYCKLSSSYLSIKALF